MAAFQEAAAQYGISPRPDLNAAFRVPGILSDAAGSNLPPSFEAALPRSARAGAHDAERVPRAGRRRDSVSVMLERNRAIAASGRADGEHPREARPALPQPSAGAAGGTARPAPTSIRSAWRRKRRCWPTAAISARRSAG